MTTRPFPDARCIEAELVAPQAWRNGGGQTRELLAWPDAANWQLRISRADIEKDGPFSAFPGIERWFAVLSGNGVVLQVPHDVTLAAGDAPLQFDGALAPGCTLVNGATQDLNLMARGGKGFMQVVQNGSDWHTAHSMCGLYTVAAGTWRCGAQELALNAHTLLWFANAPAAPQHFQANMPGPAYWLGYTPETSA
jgi:environmental stress-induced protein Ves